MRMEAWRSFLEAHAALTGILEDELVAARQLPLAWYDVLVQLSEAPGGRMRMLDLAHAVLLSKSGLTRLFDRMEDAGLVRRAPCAEDARGVNATMTEAGWQRLVNAAPEHVQSVRDHLVDVLTPEQFAALGDAMQVVADRIVGGGCDDDPGVPCHVA